MGTGGHFIVKYRGRYWTFDNGLDSYLEGMGQSLVDQVPADQAGYQKWLQSQRSFFAKWDDLLEKLLTVQPE